MKDALNLREAPRAAAVPLNIDQVQTVQAAEDAIIEVAAAFLIVAADHTDDDGEILDLIAKPQGP